MSLLRYARLPRPASKAAPPIPNSRPSCSPAVPPPPVDGGPAGTAGAVVVCGDAVVACAVAVVVCGDAAAAGGGVVVCAGGAFADAAGEVFPVDVGEPVHAETETETTTVKVAPAAK